MTASSTTPRIVSSMPLCCAVCSISSSVTQNIKTYIPGFNAGFHDACRLENRSVTLPPVGRHLNDKASPPPAHFLIFVSANWVPTAAPLCMFRIHVSRASSDANFQAENALRYQVAIIGRLFSYARLASWRATRDPKVNRLGPI
jgi:hypothetical protein